MNELEGLKHRLDRLERENRWLKRLGTFVLVGATALALMGGVGEQVPSGRSRYLDEAEIQLGGEILQAQHVAVGRVPGTHAAPEEAVRLGDRAERGRAGLSEREEEVDDLDAAGFAEIPPGATDLRRGVGARDLHVNLPVAP